MNSSTSVSAPGRLLAQMIPAATARFATESGWARAAGVPKETLSRLKSQPSCDLRTLVALASAAGFTLAAVRADAAPGQHWPAGFDREAESRLLDLAASRDVDPVAWRSHGPAFFMAGLAVMLASAKGFAREPLLRLAETLHPGSSSPEAFAAWLAQSPVRPSRFLPMARQRMARP